MNRKYLIKAYPAGWGREAYRNIEICGDATLNRLCQIIRESFDFTDEHLYEFMYDEYNYQSDPEGDEPSAEITLDELGLVEKQKFSLHYVSLHHDFGDDWMFVITVKKISEVPEKIEPRVIKSKGNIQQYLDWDEGEWDDE